MKTAVVFAGQGSQFPGMGRDFYDTFPEFRAIYDRLPEEQLKVAMDGPAEILSETVNTQPIMLAFAAGVFQILKNKGFRPAAGAGLSLGEYSALQAAGVLDEDTALALISFRARAMEDASKGVDTAMSAVMGLDPALLKEICEKAGGRGIAEVSNLNSPGQAVISGTTEGIENAEALAKEAGASRCIRLNVSGPFHTSYMEPAADALRERFGRIEFREMEFPVYFNYTGRPICSGESVPMLLEKQVCRTVRFRECIENMLADGIERFVEIGPGKALSGFIKKIDRKIPCISITSVEDLQKIEEFL